MIRFAIVTEIDNAAGKARVQFPIDNIQSDWLPIVVPNAKVHKWSFPLSLNEQVACVMDEKLNKGVILGAVYSKVTEPAIVDGKYGVKFADGTKFEYNPQNGQVNIATHGKLIIEAAAEIEITATNKLTLHGDLKVEGKIDATGEVAAKAGTAGQVRLSTHVHPTPVGPSSPPTPGT